MRQCCCCVSAAVALVQSALVQLLLVPPGGHAGGGGTVGGFERWNALPYVGAAVALKPDGLFLGAMLGGQTMQVRGDCL
jgi:hypothetical protein